MWNGEKGWELCWSKKREKKVQPIIYLRKIYHPANFLDIGIFLCTDQRMRLISVYLRTKKRVLSREPSFAPFFVLPPAHRPPDGPDLCRRPWRNASSPAPDSLRSTVPSCLRRSLAYSPVPHPPLRVANRTTKAKRRRRRRPLSWWRRLPRAGGRTPRSARGMGRRRTTRTPACPGGAGGLTSRGSPRPSSPRCISTSNTIGSLSLVRLLHFSCCSITSLRLYNLHIVIFRCVVCFPKNCYIGITGIRIWGTPL